MLSGEETSEGGRNVTMPSHVGLVTVRLVRALRNIANGRINDTVTELLGAVDVILCNI